MATDPKLVTDLVAALPTAPPHYRGQVIDQLYDYLVQHDTLIPLVSAPILGLVRHPEPVLQAALGRFAVLFVTHWINAAAAATHGDPAAAAAAAPQTAALPAMHVVGQMVAHADTRVIAAGAAAFGAIYPPLFAHLALRSDPRLKVVAEPLDQLKRQTLALLSPSQSPALLISLLPVVTRVIRTQSRATDRMPLSKGAPSLLLVPDVHPFLHAEHLEREAVALFGRITALLTAPQTAYTLMTAIAAALIQLCYTRYQFTANVVRALADFLTKRPEHLTLFQYRSVKRGLRSALMALMAHPCAKPLTRQLGTLLLQLKFRQADIQLRVKAQAVAIEKHEIAVEEAIAAVAAQNREAAAASAAAGSGLAHPADLAGGASMAGAMKRRHDHDAVADAADAAAAHDKRPRPGGALAAAPTSGAALAGAPLSAAGWDDVGVSQDNAEELEAMAVPLPPELRDAMHAILAGRLSSSTATHGGLDGLTPDLQLQQRYQEADVAQFLLSTLAEVSDAVWEGALVQRFGTAAREHLLRLQAAQQHTGVNAPVICDPPTLLATAKLIYRAVRRHASDDSDEDDDDDDDNDNDRVDADAEIDDAETVHAVSDGDDVAMASATTNAAANATADAILPKTDGGALYHIKTEGGTTTVAAAAPSTILATAPPMVDADAVPFPTAEDRTTFVLGVFERLFESEAEATAGVFEPLAAAPAATDEAKLVAAGDGDATASPATGCVTGATEGASAELRAANAALVVGLGKQGSTLASTQLEQRFFIALHDAARPGAGATTGAVAPTAETDTSQATLARRAALAQSYLTALDAALDTPLPPKLPARQLTLTVEGELQLWFQMAARLALLLERPTAPSAEQIQQAGGTDIMIFDATDAPAGTSPQAGTHDSGADSSTLASRADSRTPVVNAHGDPSGHEHGADDEAMKISAQPLTDLILTKIRSNFLQHWYLAISWLSFELAHQGDAAYTARLRQFLSWLGPPSPRSNWDNVGPDGLEALAASKFVLTPSLPLLTLFLTSLPQIPQDESILFDWVMSRYCPAIRKELALLDGSRVPLPAAPGPADVSVISQATTPVPSTALPALPGAPDLADLEITLTYGLPLLRHLMALVPVMRPRIIRVLLSGLRAGLPVLRYNLAQILVALGQQELVSRRRGEPGRLAARHDDGTVINDGPPVASPEPDDSVVAALVREAEASIDRLVAWDPATQGLSRAYLSRAPPRVHTIDEDEDDEDDDATATMEGLTGAPSTPVAETTSLSHDTEGVKNEKDDEEDEEDEWDMEETFGEVDAELQHRRAVLLAWRRLQRHALAGVTRAVLAMAMPIVLVLHLHTMHHGAAAFPPLLKRLLAVWNQLPRDAQHWLGIYLRHTLLHPRRLLRRPPAATAASSTTAARAAAPLDGTGVQALMQLLDEVGPPDTNDALPRWYAAPVQPAALDSLIAHLAARKPVGLVPLTALGTFVQIILADVWAAAGTSASQPSKTTVTGASAPPGALAAPRTPRLHRARRAQLWQWLWSRAAIGVFPPAWALPYLPDLAALLAESAAAAKTANASADAATTISPLPDLARDVLPVLFAQMPYTPQRRDTIALTRPAVFVASVPAVPDPAATAALDDALAALAHVPAPAADAGTDTDTDADADAETGVDTEAELPVGPVTAALAAASARRLAGPGWVPIETVISGLVAGFPDLDSDAGAAITAPEETTAPAAAPVVARSPPLLSPLALLLYIHTRLPLQLSMTGSAAPQTPTPAATRIAAQLIQRCLMAAPAPAAASSPPASAGPVGLAGLFPTPAVATALTQLVAAYTGMYLSPASAGPTASADGAASSDAAGELDAAPPLALAFRTCILLLRQRPTTARFVANEVLKPLARARGASDATAAPAAPAGEDSDGLWRLHPHAWRGWGLVLAEVAAAVAPGAAAAAAATAASPTASPATGTTPSTHANETSSASPTAASASAASLAGMRVVLDVLLVLPSTALQRSLLYAAPATETAPAPETPLMKALRPYLQSLPAATRASRVIRALL